MHGLSLPGGMYRAFVRVTGGKCYGRGKCRGWWLAIESMCIWIVCMSGKYSSYVYF